MKQADDNTPILEQGERYSVDVETRYGTIEIEIIAAEGGITVNMKEPHRAFPETLVRLI